MEKTATLSDDGVYRYALGRVWDPAFPVMRWIMLNPSTADAEKDDRTILRCIGFAQDWGYGGLTVHNLFALRSTDPDALATHPDPVGPDNAWHLAGARMEPWPTYSWPLTVAAWGAHKTAVRSRDGRPSRAEQVLSFLSLANVDCHALGLTKDGYPRHPLYCPATTELVPVHPAKAATYV